MPSRFQSTHPRGVRRRQSVCSPPGASFNPRTREGCDADWLTLTATCPRFNPRTREGCDQQPHLGPLRRQVSIHAPARGATRRGRCRRPPAPCFNPRTREGCDSPSRWRRFASIRFNPRTREGCDTTSSSSWRTPTRFNPRTREGCDLSASPSRSLPNEFQSTHPRGVRRESGLRRTGPDQFQSTHPRGVRPRPRCRSPGARSRFNPRTREGCDHKVAVQVLKTVVSIHAPARGATTGCPARP